MSPSVAQKKTCQTLAELSATCRRSVATSREATANWGMCPPVLIIVSILWVHFDIVWYSLYAFVLSHTFLFCVFCICMKYNFEIFSIAFKCLLVTKSLHENPLHILIFWSYLNTIFFFLMFIFRHNPYLQAWRCNFAHPDGKNDEAGAKSRVFYRRVALHTKPRQNDTICRIDG